MRTARASGGSTDQAEPVLVRVTGAAGVPLLRFLSCINMPDILSIFFQTPEIQRRLTIRQTKSPQTG